MSYRWVTGAVTTTDTEITNHREVTENPAVIDAAKALLSASVYKKAEIKLGVVIYAI